MGAQTHGTAGGQVRRNVIAVIILFVATAGAMAALLGLANHDPATTAGSVVSVTGTGTCLPHKQSGPTTLECAFGLKSDDGRYYILHHASQAQLQQSFDARVTVRGTLHPPASDSIYAIVGVIDVESMQPQQ